MAPTSSCSRRLRQQLTSFDFTDPTIPKYSIYSIYIFQVFVPNSCKTHYRAGAPPFISLDESLARRNRQRSCLLCCTVRNSIVRQKHPTSSVRSCLNEENARKRGAKKKKSTTKLGFRASVAEKRARYGESTSECQS